MTRAEAITAQAAGEAVSLVMSEPEFNEFYAATARSLKSYLVRVTANTALADDLLQESYCRILSAGVGALDSAQRRSYLFKIATNLARDHFRSKKSQVEELPETLSTGSFGGAVQTAADVDRALGQIAPRDRELVWLAYVEGASHREIAAVTGLQEDSIRPMLFRIRKKLAGLLRERKAQ
jgi:RNA polymerase sigma-70 factor, ECF subfamily